MNHTQWISELFPEVDPLTGLVHPASNQSYQMLTPSQLLRMAEQILTRIEKTGIDQVIVSESGSVPFARICAMVATRKKKHINWYAVKIPRNIIDTFHVTFKTYLSLPEKALRLSETSNAGFSYGISEHKVSPPNFLFDADAMTLKEIVNTLQYDHVFPEKNWFLKMSEGSALAQILKKPFIFFDEYIDSGKTLFQSIRFMSLFSDSLHFRIMSYMTHLYQKDMDTSFIDSLHTLDDGWEMYALGVYPFENRIDCLGYYWLITPDILQKIPVSDLVMNTRDICQKTVSSLTDNPIIQILLRNAKNHCKVSDISEWITEKQAFYWLLYHTEKSCFGINPFSEFWYQLFDMYGPIWSPFPDAWHQAYLDAFESEDPWCQPDIVRQYQTIREPLIHCVADLFEKRRKQQNLILLKTMETLHEYQY